MVEENRIVLICGQSGAGKSTSSRALFDRLETAALLNGSNLATVEPFVWGDKLDDLCIRNAAAVTRNMFDAGFSQVVLSGIGRTQQLVDEFLALLGRRVTCCYFSLVAETSERTRRRLARARDGADTDISFHPVLDKLMTASGHINHVLYREIDTTDLSADQVVDEMVVHLRQHRYRFRGALAVG